MLPTTTNASCARSQVASVAIDEDEEIVEAAPTEAKTWTDIIPQEVRDKAQEEEEQKKRLALYLPPRKRKSVKKVQARTRRSRRHRHAYAAHAGTGTHTPLTYTRTQAQDAHVRSRTFELMSVCGCCALQMNYGQKGHSDSDGEERRKKRRGGGGSGGGKKKKSATDSELESDADGKDGVKRKRGRPRTIKREDVDGFNDSEIRR